jgi:hypothetical protein
MIKGGKVAGSVVAAEVMAWVIGYRRFLKADLGKHTRACGRRASEESGEASLVPVRGVGGGTHARGILPQRAN